MARVSLLCTTYFLFLFKYIGSCDQSLL
uniref:Uncharacterized protein n=1 Tax=Arundo donax TaxID=35708 RepID=A0A0A9AJY5_ARUDO